MKAEKKRSQIATSRNLSGNSGGKRFGLVVVVFVMWMCGIGFRLIDLQANQHETLLTRAVDQRRHEHKTKPLRGSILDRNGRELAVTLEAESLEIDPTELENVEQTSFQLGKILGKNPKELVFTFNEGKAAHRRSIPLGRELEPEIVDKIKNLGIAKGLIWRKEQKRFYPNETLCAQVLGFTNREDAGQAGIESTEEKNLRGDYGQVTEERDGSGRVYELTESINQQPRNVVLTIDYALQHTVEQALAEGIATAQAKSGAAVVLNPATGEILAMANAPTFNPNKPGDSKPEMWTNRAVQNFYEPGSTFKLVTYSATLEEKIATPNDTIDTHAGQIKIGSRVIKDPGSGGLLTLTQALAKSSNVAAITLGGRIGKERLYDYIRRFGFGVATGVELPVESRGMLSAPEKWTADSIGSIPIGYEVGVTTLQSAAAFGTVANDGVRIAPHIIKEIREEDGKVLAQTAPEQRRVVSPETARNMRRMLEAVTEAGGTAKRAQLAGYTSAGKTGTAYKYDPGKGKYSQNKFVASFVGFAPIDNPAVVIAVMIDEPRGGAHHGGDVAAPIFRDIAEQILPALHIAPDNLPGVQSQTLVARQRGVAGESSKLTEKTVESKNIAATLDEKIIQTKPPVKSADKVKLAGKTPEKVITEKAVKPNELRERPVEPKKPTPQTNGTKIRSSPVIKAKAENSPNSNSKAKGKT
ncbi:MAG: penicillin-binding protein 2 [Pyrinomonadaceae bacterium]